METFEEKRVIDICFCNSTIKELNEIIEAELLKDDADLELIDECCRVLELINAEVFDSGSGFNAEAIHTAEAIIKKYNSQKYQKIILSASCAVLLGAVAGATLLFNGDSKIDRGENLRVEATENIRSESAESTSEKQSTENKATTTQATRVKKLKVMQPYDNSSLVFDNRASINLDGFYIYVEMLDGSRYSVIPSECQYEVLETAEDGATRVRVTYNGFETFITVTVSVPEITTEYIDYDDYYEDDYDYCDGCVDDFWASDDELFTEEETSATIEENAVEETSSAESEEAN